MLATAQGLLLALALIGLQRAGCGPDYVPLELWGGVALGVALGAARGGAGPSLRRSAAAALLLGLTWVLLAGWALPAGALLGAGAGLICAAEPSRARPARLLGAALGTWAGSQLSPDLAWLSGLCLAAAAAISLRPGPEDPSEHEHSLGGALRSAPALVRCASLVVLAAAGLRFLSGGWPEALGLALSAHLLGLALACLLARVFVRRAIGGLPSLLGAEFLGWGVTWLASGRVLEAVREGGSLAPLLCLVALGGLLSAPAWSPGSSRALEERPKLRWQEGPLALTLLVALLSGSPLGTYLFNATLSGASAEARLALALGRGDALSVKDAVYEGRVAARVWARTSMWPSTSCVVEANQDKRRLRLLSRAGVVRSALPTQRGASLHPEAPAVGAAALAAWSGASPIQQSGLGDGVLAATLGLRSEGAGDPVLVFEVDRGILSLHAHPARPFAFRAGELSDLGARLQLVPPSARPPAALVAYALPPRELPPGEFVLPLSVLPGDWLEAFKAREVWAFVLGEGLVLTTRAPALADLEAGWKRDPELARALSAVGVNRPLELLSCLVASPAGLRALAEERARGEDPHADVAPQEVLRVGARTLVHAPLDLGQGARAAAARAALAELLVRRESPAALPFARAALADLRSSTTLRTLGDVLHLEGARRGSAPEQDPFPLWKEALERDPADVGARLALGWHHYDRKAFAEVQRVLLPGVGRDPQRERELQYLLGLAAMGLHEAGPAQLHFRAARGFRNADDLAALAQSMARTQRAKDPPQNPAPTPAPPQPTTPLGPPATPAPAATGPQARNRIRAAELFWRQSQLKTGDTQLGALLNSADTLTRAASGRGQLSPKELLAYARLLGKVGRALDVRKGVALQAAALARIEAEVLIPLAQGSPRRAIDRAKALWRGGQGAQAVSELEELIAGEGARLPAAHVALAELHLRAKRYGLGVKVYHQALAVSPNTSGTAKIYQALAGAYVLNRRVDQARSVLEAANRLYPDHPKIMLALAEIYVQLEQSGDARRVLRAFLKSAPETHPDRARAEAALAGLEPQ